MNNIKQTNQINPFGLGGNFQSGFGNLNDISDSIGSLFGFGPEDRNSVLQRGRTELQPLLSSILRTFEANGLSSAIVQIDSAIETKTRKLKSFKSSNSKAKEQQDIDLLNELKVSLKVDSNSAPKNTDATDWRSSTPASASSSNTMFLGLGVLVLMLAKFTKTFK